MTRELAALALVVACGGCAQNALLELDVTVPTDPVGGATVAVLDMASSTAEDPAEVRFVETRRVNLALPPVGMPEQYITVFAGDDTATPLWISVRYCAEADCLGLGPLGDRAGRSFVRFERPFWPGERGRAALTLPAPGSDVTLLDQCRVVACAGEGVTDGCCSAITPNCEEGAHLCERL